MEKVKFCPYCGKDNIQYAIEWDARSLDPSDSCNSGMIAEWQCHDCAASFWTTLDILVVPMKP